MNREKLSLSYFEVVLHRKHKKVTLVSEIEDCFAYFEKHTPKMFENESISLIHGSKIELKKVPEGKGYSVQTDDITKIVGKDEISKPEQMTMVRKIRSITIPYSEYKSK